MALPLADQPLERTLGLAAFGLCFHLADVVLASSSLDGQSGTISAWLIGAAAYLFASARLNIHWARQCEEQAETCEPSE